MSVIASLLLLVAVAATAGGYVSYRWYAGVPGIARWEAPLPGIGVGVILGVLNWYSWGVYL